MQGGHGYGGGYGYSAYGYNAGGAYGSTGGYGYDAGAYGSVGAYGYGFGAYYSSVYPPAPPYEEAGRMPHDFPAPPLVDGIELQASEACPKDYVIFDQTSTTSCVTFHPSLAHRLAGASSAAAPGYGSGGHDDNEGCSPVRHKEDSAEIDALLMSSEDDDDVVSTGRAPGAAGSPDSTCSSSSGRPRRKKERIKKMMRTLKGILPGGGKMDAPAVLDEAVWYLKSLNVQANKQLGGSS